MPDTAVKVALSAVIAMDGLAEDVRERLVKTVERLQATDPATWSPDEIIRLPDPEPLYLLRLPPDYRIFLRRIDTNELEIRDIVRQGLLDRWFRQDGRNGGGTE